MAPQASAMHMACIIYLSLCKASETIIGIKELPC